MSDVNFSNKPILIYDGECAFCRYWIGRWRVLTGERIEYTPFQQVASRFSTITIQEYAAAIHLIETDGRVFRGAEAALRTLMEVPRWRWAYWLYRRGPGVAFLAERCYGWIARNRGRLWLWMNPP